MDKIAKNGERNMLSPGDLVSFLFLDQLFQKRLAY